MQSCRPRIKSYLDYGAFTPIQVAATAALNVSDRGCVKTLLRVIRAQD
jgi:alanine-synthesizing transaminase